LIEKALLYPWSLFERRHLVEQAQRYFELAARFNTLTANFRIQDYELVIGSIINGLSSK
jgi:hypothetical protein